MLLVDGTYRDAVNYDMRSDIVSVTFNYVVEAAALSDIYSESRNTALDDPYESSCISSYRGYDLIRRRRGYR